MLFSISLLLFFFPHFPPLSPVVIDTLPPQTPPPPVSLPYFISDEGRVQQEVHLHLYHTCNVLSALTAGLSSVVSTCHFGSRTPVIPGPHPKAHFTRCTRGAASNVTCPDYRLATICSSSPCSKKHRRSLQMFFSSTLHPKR